MPAISSFYSGIVLISSTLLINHYEMYEVCLPVGELTRNFTKCECTHMYNNTTNTTIVYVNATNLTSIAADAFNDSEIEILEFTNISIDAIAINLLFALTHLKISSSGHYKPVSNISIRSIESVNRMTVSNSNVSMLNITEISGNFKLIVESASIQSIFLPTPSNIIFSIKHVQFGDKLLMAIKNPVEIRKIVLNFKGENDTSHDVINLNRFTNLKKLKIYGSRFFSKSVVLPTSIKHVVTNINGNSNNCWRNLRLVCITQLDYDDYDDRNIYYENRMQEEFIFNNVVYTRNKYPFIY
ncbi:hypothetical protein GJ496_000405 [Pomphorhynchus laevis]|nr:hypothetical protein GJ496_000405 [Pomphorhynchus laevis]